MTADPTFSYGTPAMPTPSTLSDTAPNGPIWAGILAAGIGCAAFGGIVDLAEASKAVSNALNFYRPTGDLSGKTTVALVVWLLAWAGLSVAWKRREIRAGGAVLTITLLLVLLSIVAIFPPFMELFAR